MSELVDEVAGVRVSTFATPAGPRISIITLDAQDGARLTWSDAAALAGVILRASDKVCALEAKKKA